MKLQDVSLVIYTESLDELKKAYGKANLAATQKKCAQIILIHNSQEPLDKHFEDKEHTQKTLEIIEMKERLSQGAALNKALPYIIGAHSFFVDQSCCSYLALLESLEQLSAPNLRTMMLSVPLSEDLNSYYSAYQQRQIWPHSNFASLYFIPWGAFLINTQYLYHLSGFDERFHTHDMLLVLSMKAQKNEGILLQICQPNIDVAPIKQSSKSFQKRLAKKYFPQTLSVYDKIHFWWKSVQKDTAQLDLIEKKEQYLIH